MSCQLVDAVKCEMIVLFLACGKSGTMPDVEMSLILEAKGHGFIEDFFFSLCVCTCLKSCQRFVCEREYV